VGSEGPHARMGPACSDRAGLTRWWCAGLLGVAAPAAHWWRRRLRALAACPAHPNSPQRARTQQTERSLALQTVFWTDYVATRWYRAPELCGSFFAKYSPAIDIWWVHRQGCRQGRRACVGASVWVGGCKEGAGRSTAAVLGSAAAPQGRSKTWH
jgi:serine/threonine protein kinase